MYFHALSSGWEYRRQVYYLLGGTAMRKIMFNDRFMLTQAVLEGIKTQTRRIIPLTYQEEEYLDYAFDFDLRESDIIDYYARYKIGEIVAVAQCYNDVSDYPNKVKDLNIDFTGEQGKAFTNKMFVKSEFMPHQIKITNVRVQRLKDITDDECLLEGIEKEERTDDKYNYIFFDAKRELYIRERTPRDAYARLIDALSGKGTWASNPYVFVYDFKLIK